MKREQVPDELIQLATSASDAYSVEVGDDPERFDWDDYRRAILAAVLSEHEKQVREQVAKDIEDTVCAPPEGHDKPCPDCYRYRQMQRDARIAREGL